MKKLKNKFTNASDFSGGIAQVEFGNEEFYINRKGFTVYGGQNILPFYKKRIISVPDSIPYEKNGRYGIVNIRTKEIIIPFEYEFCWYFLEYGLAQVCKNGKYGFVNSRNEIIIPIEYDSIGALGFQSGLCLVEKNNKCGFIDKDNNLIIPLKYGPDSREFCEGIACVEVFGKNINYYKYITQDNKDAF